MVLAGGLPSERLDLDAFVEQGRAYHEVEGLDKLRRLGAELGLTHSSPVKRAHEVMQWVQSGEYDRIVGGEYVRRGSEAGLREEADAATEHYTERFKTLFREAGDAVGKASGAAADAAERLGDWLRGGRGSGDE
jgi:hypothetical protein